MDLFISENQAKPFVLPENEGQIEVMPATIGAIREACDNWIGRCTANKKNLCVFYFCGHGVYIGDSTILLLEDYGESNNLPFQGAFDFTKLWNGVRSVVEGDKCLFADACSNVPDNNLDIEEAGAAVLLPIYKNFFTKNLTVFRGAVEGSSAYGKDDKVSRFTQALIECLSGRAADKDKEDGPWIITNELLTFTLSKALREINEAEGGIAQVASPDANTGPIRLQVFKDLPQVPFVVEFVPSDAIDAVKFSLVSKADPNWKLVYPNPPEDPQLINSSLKFSVPIGNYLLGAQFPNKPYRAVENHEIECSPPGPGPGSPIDLDFLQ